MSSSKTDRIVEIISNDLTYLPSPEQRRVKSAFWVRFNENPLCAPEDISISIAEQFIRDSRIEKWWAQDGFREWFRNQEEFRERVESLVYLAMDRLERLLIDDRGNASAQVNAAKLLMEIGRKMPPKSATVHYADQKIGEMDRKQLEEYIARNLRVVAPELGPDTTSKPTID